MMVFWLFNAICDRKFVLDGSQERAARIVKVTALEHPPVIPRN
jgi:hypothetical protein